MRKQFGLTQVDLAAKSGVGLGFVRELKQGKETLRLDKVNQVLLLFGQNRTCSYQKRINFINHRFLQRIVDFSDDNDKETTNHNSHLKTQDMKQGKIISLRPIRGTAD